MARTWLLAGALSINPENSTVMRVQVAKRNTRFLQTLHQDIHIICGICKFKVAVAPRPKSSTSIESMIGVCKQTPSSLNHSALQPSDFRGETCAIDMHQVRQHRSANSPFASTMCLTSHTNPRRKPFIDSAAIDQQPLLEECIQAQPVLPHRPCSTYYSSAHVLYKPGPNNGAADAAGSYCCKAADKSPSAN